MWHHMIKDLWALKRSGMKRESGKETNKGMVRVTYLNLNQDRKRMRWQWIRNFATWAHDKMPCLPRKLLRSQTRGHSFIQQIASLLLLFLFFCFFVFFLNFEKDSYCHFDLIIKFS